ncbi:hypothetical protein RRG08_021122 [Elysia crispata]|uniref:Uncharacterized protein n=1 Tax=Elysia crispata TaxID=231223 RepID=A0AAE0Z5Q9_9GAST|nr:hypothetical protein RRG08_021122 [Elysia crispata]
MQRIVDAHRSEFSCFVPPVKNTACTSLSVITRPKEKGCKKINGTVDLIAAYSTPPCLIQIDHLTTGAVYSDMLLITCVISQTVCPNSASMIDTLNHCKNSAGWYTVLHTQAATVSSSSLFHQAMTFCHSKNERPGLEVAGQSSELLACIQVMPHLLHQWLQLTRFNYTRAKRFDCCSHRHRKPHNFAFPSGRENN